MKAPFHQPRISILTICSFAVLLVACNGDNGGTGVDDGTGTVSGSVELQNGTPVAGASLALSRTGETTRTAQSGADGSYTFQQIPTGNWTLAITPPTGYELGGQVGSVSVTVTRNQTTTRDFTLTEAAPTTGAITATVRTDGALSQGVQLRLYNSGAQTHTTTATTAASGQATFNDVTPGNYDVEVVIPSGVELAAGEDGRKPVQVSAGVTAQVAFALVTVGGGVVEVTLTGNTFVGGTITIPVGTTVRWINGDGMDHTVTPDDHDEWEEWATSAAGETFEHTFDSAGAFPYFCVPHVDLGMTGTITVQ